MTEEPEDQPAPDEGEAPVQPEPAIDPAPKQGALGEIPRYTEDDHIQGNVSDEVDGPDPEPDEEEEE